MKPCLLFTCLFLVIGIGCEAIPGIGGGEPAPLTAYELDAARASLHIQYALDGGAENVPDNDDDGAVDCSCNGSGRSGDGIGPCVCVAKSGTCTCSRESGAVFEAEPPSVTPVEAQVPAEAVAVAASVPGDAAQAPDDTVDPALNCPCPAGSCQCPGGACQCPKVVAEEPPVTAAPQREVVMGTAIWCGSCRVLKQRFEAAGIPVTYLDIDNPSDQERVQTYWPNLTSIPAVCLVEDGAVKRQYPPGHGPVGEIQAWLQSPAVAEQVPAVTPKTDVVVKTLSPHVPVRVADAAGHTTDLGSGTVIQDGYVLTVAHVFTSPGNPQVGLDRVWTDAEIIARDAEKDLLLLKFDPPQHLAINAVPIAPADYFGPAEVCGYAQGTYGRRTVHIQPSIRLRGGEEATSPTFHFSTVPFIVGESGGGVLHAGQLVGVVHGRDNDINAGLLVQRSVITDFIAPHLE